MKTKLQGRIKDLEDELKKTREDIEKKNQAAQEQENEVPYLGLIARKLVLGGVVNNKGAEQPVHLRSLNSTFVICLLESIMTSYRLVTNQIPNL